MFEILDGTTFDDVPAPAQWIDVSGLKIEALIEALCYSAKGFWASSFRGLRHTLAEPLGKESITDLRSTLSLRFRNIRQFDGIIASGEMYVASYNGRFGPWYWRPGLAEQVVEILRAYEVAPDEIPEILHLRRESRRASAFCEFIVTELNSGPLYTLEESELRAFIFALYLACPHPGSLPDWKFIFSPHEGDLERFANTLGVGIGIAPDQSREGVADAPLQLLVRTGAYDFRYGLPGLDNPPSYSVFERVSSRIREGVDNPWDTRGLAVELQEESERRQRTIARDVNVAGRFCSLFTVVATFIGGNGMALPKVAPPPIHVLCHAGLEVAAALTAVKRKKRDGEEEEETADETAEERAAY